MRGTLVLVLCGLLAAAPAFGQAGALSQVAVMKDPAQQLQVVGTTLYLVADRTIRTFDITNPAAPRPVTTYTFAERISTFVVSGTLVYALIDFFGLRVLDLSNAANPTLRGALELKGGVISATLFNPQTILTANMVAGVQVLDVSNPERPSLVTSHYTDGYVQDVFASRPHVYVTDDPTGLHVLDVSKTASPAQVSVTELDIPPPPGGIGLVDFPQLRLATIDRRGSAANQFVTILDRTSSQLLFFDLSNVGAPAALGRFKALPRSERLKAHASRVYVAAAEGLQVVDASDPKNPVSGGLFKTEQPARDVAVTDAFVFVAIGAGGVVVLRR